MSIVTRIHMGLLDFLKKLMDSAKEIEEAAVTKTVKTKDLRKWIQSQKEDISNDESEFLKQVKQRILLLADELETETKALKEVTLDKIQAETRAKIIVGTNIDLYIGHLTDLITLLRELNITTTDNLFENITAIFKNFEQKSIKSFQKAAVLAGHKLSDIGVSTGKFFNDLRQLMKDNETLITRSKIIHSIDSKLTEIDNFEKTKSEFKSNMDNFESKIKDLESEKKRVEKEMETVKKSKTHIKEIKKREKLEKDETELTKSIYELRTLIDFKILANTFHSNPKQMAIVKAYKANFEDAFHKDSSNKLINLLEEAELHKGQILSSIDKINKTKQNIRNTVFETDQVAILNLEIGKIKIQIDDIQPKKDLEQKKHDKFETNRDNMFDSIRDKLSKINVELE
jgi:hypothetical protein